MWTKDGGELPDLDRMIVEGRELTFTSLNKTDNGTYRCDAGNHLGTSNAEYVLYVYDIPTTPPPSTAPPLHPIPPDPTALLGAHASDPTVTGNRDHVESYGARASQLFNLATRAAAESKRRTLRRRRRRRRRRRLRRRRCETCAVCLNRLSITAHPDTAIFELSGPRQRLENPNALGQHGTDHALIGGVVAVVVFVTLCLIIVLGRYLARHKGNDHRGDEKH
ncbi:Cell adhesion molecule 2 [Liparis tanakae]|uniref:Cell adhesion molecule 2 n=1 Tax=Liparis tanakae TaxID=230148 RepID=A0A4Z2GC71_9TELE|nr:Cell adhesion molecule 2 [Liparis tanakae]